ncbi:Thiamine pyrophosphate enzyme [Hirschfeldia incana]|nr:Thiamine pyrophosphate enzyme [Hirschfeldia incana]
MATITNISTSFYKHHDHSSSKTLLPVSKLALPFALNPLKPSYSRCSSKHGSLFICAVVCSPPGDDLSGYEPKKPRRGSDILVESLERQGVETVFAYHGSESTQGFETVFPYHRRRIKSTELQDALECSSLIRHILSHSGKSALFAAEGYARTSQKPGICIIAASDHHKGDYLTSCISDTGVPLVAITSQYISDYASMRFMTKHIFQVMNAEEIPKIIEEAFFLATSGRPGLVLINFPEDIKKYYGVPSWESYWDQILSLIKESKKPMLHVGGGCLNAIDELNRFVQLTGIPVTSAIMGLGSYPSNDEFSLQTFGMQRTLYANHALKTCDLLLAFGVGSDEPLPGNAKTVHIDIDASGDMGRRPLVPVRVDVKLAFQEMNKILEERADELNLDFKPWRMELKEYKQHTPLSFKPPEEEEGIPPEYVIQVLNELTYGNAFMTTGVGQHHMWAAQLYKCKKPMHWLPSRGFEAMGFGLSAAIGASVANPNETVVYIDGDGSFLKNVPNLLTIVTENLPVKILMLDKKYVGVYQAGEMSYKKSFLGDKTTIIADMLRVAKINEIPGRRVSRREEVRGAIQTMLETPGPYMLDVIVPHEREILG